MHKVFVIVSDERLQPMVSRAAIIFVYEIRAAESDVCFVNTQELVSELQKSPEAVAGPARMSVDIALGPMLLRTSFYVLRDGAEFLGLPEVPELSVTRAAATTGCEYTLHIFLDALPEKSEVKVKVSLSNFCLQIILFMPLQVEPTTKRHRASRSLPDEDEEEYRKSASNRSSPLPSAPTVRATPAEREAAQLRWLAGPSGYDNVIAAAARVRVETGYPGARLPFP